MRNERGTKRERSKAEKDDSNARILSSRRARRKEKGQGTAFVPASLKGHAFTGRDFDPFVV